MKDYEHDALKIEALETACRVVEKYHGWANRETWAAYLWLTNDEGLYRKAIETLGPFDRKSIETLGGPVRLENLVYGLFDYETLTPATYRMREDIGSLWRVNWRESVTRLLDEDRTDVGTLAEKGGE